MLSILLVFIGGGVGALMRYGVTAVASSFGWHGRMATLLVNIVGSFLLGWIATRYSAPIQRDNSIRLLLAVGLCGGFTTFSTFSMDTVTLLKNGAWLQALGYVFLSLILSFLALGLAIHLASNLRS